MSIRIVQWTTGNVGKRSVVAIAANPGLELVGCFAWSPDKVGRDVGELCGLAPLGVRPYDGGQASHFRIDLNAWRVSRNTSVGSRMRRALRARAASPVITTFASQEQHP